MSQRQPSNPDLSTQRPDLVPLVTAVEGLRKPIHLVVRLMRGTVIAVVVVAVVIVIVGGVLLWNASSVTSRLAELAAQIDETARLQREALARTQQKVEDVRADVAEVKADQPVIELKAADAGAGKAQAVVVVRPRPARPQVSASAGAPPVPPAVEIPVRLPEGSKAVVEDAGAGKL